MYYVHEKVRRGIRFLGTGVTGSYDPLCVCWELILPPKLSQICIQLSIHLLYRCLSHRSLPTDLHTIRPVSLRSPIDEAVISDKH